MVLAEAVKFDAGTVVLVLLFALFWLGVASATLGVIGLGIGFALGRRGLDPAVVAGLRRGRSFWLWSIAMVLPVPSWLLIWWLAGGVYTGTGWPVVVPASGVVASAIWGFWNGRERRFSDTVGGQLPPPPSGPSS